MHDHDAPLQAVAGLLGHGRFINGANLHRVSVGRMMKTMTALRADTGVRMRPVIEAAVANARFV